MCFFHQYPREPVESENLRLNGMRPVRDPVRQVTVVEDIRRDVARRVKIRKSPQIAIGLPRSVRTTGGLPRCYEGAEGRTMEMEGAEMVVRRGRGSLSALMVCCGDPVGVERHGMLR